jgi:hypothetical protein
MQLLIFASVFQIPWNPHVLFISLPAYPSPADKPSYRRVNRQADLLAGRQVVYFSA